MKSLTPGIKGWLTKKEQFFLYNAARTCSGKGVIVELGSWMGKSAICLAKGSRESLKSKVHAVDPHTGNPEHQYLNKRI